MKKEFLNIRQKLEDMIMFDGEHSRRLPPLRALAKEFGCTAPTVMRAVQTLVANGRLAPCSGGGYVSCRRDLSGFNIRVAAQIVGSGMREYDFGYHSLMRFHSVYELGNLCRNGNQTGISEQQFSTYDELDLKLRKGNFSGIVLTEPTDAVLKRSAKFCRSASVPLGIFGGIRPEGRVSVYFDIKNNFAALMQKLAGQGRRRILAVSPLANGWNSVMKETVEHYSASFECAEYYSDTHAQITGHILNNTGGKGKNFDTVVFTGLVSGAYERLMDHTPRCLCVMPVFAADKVAGFHGWIMDFDVGSAGNVFGKAMYDALWEPDSESVHYAIPFEIREIQ